MRQRFQKANRTFSHVKRWSWLAVPLIAGGGMVWPRLGLLLLPIMVSLVVLGLFKGKYWCGNICPHSSLFDYLLLPIARLGGIPRALRSRVFVGLFFLVYLMMFSVRIAGIAGLWGTLDFWDRLGFVLAANYLMPTVLGVALALTVNPRAWCSFCPMGTFQTVAYWFGRRIGINSRTDKKVTIGDATKCRACGKCAMVCPMQLEPYKEFSDSGQFDNNACIRCEVCVANCPWKLLSMANAIDAEKAKDDARVA